MAQKWYAWSEIRYGADIQEKTGVLLKNHSVPPGEEVTPDMLNVSEDEFADMVRGGSIRSYPFPDDMPENYQGSPIQWLEQKRKIAANAFLVGAEDYYGLLSNDDEPTVPVKEDEAKQNVITHL